MGRDALSFAECFLDVSKYRVAFAFSVRGEGTTYFGNVWSHSATHYHNRQDISSSGITS